MVTAHPAQSCPLQYCNGGSSSYIDEFPENAQRFDSHSCDVSSSNSVSTFSRTLSEHYVIG